MGQEWGPELSRLKKACIGPPTILIKHTNDDARRFLKEMALGALDPQTLRKIGELVPMKRTFDDLVVTMYDFILLRNIEEQSLGPFFSMPKLALSANFKFTNTDQRLSL